MIIDRIDAGYYRVPLPVALSDGTHGTITHFELITVRIGDRDGGEGVGCGGVTIFMKVAHLAEAFNLPLTSHVHDLTVQLLAAAPNRSYLEVHGFGLDRFIAQPLAIAEGRAIAPDRPSHGVAFDWAALENLRAYPVFADSPPEKAAFVIFGHR